MSTEHALILLLFIVSAVYLGYQMLTGELEEDDQ